MLFRIFKKNLKIQQCLKLVLRCHHPNYWSSYYSFHDLPLISYLENSTLFDQKIFLVFGKKQNHYFDYWLSARISNSLILLFIQLIAWFIGFVVAVNNEKVGITSEVLNGYMHYQSYQLVKLDSLNLLKLAGICFI